MAIDGWPWWWPYALAGAAVTLIALIVTAVILVRRSRRHQPKPATAPVLDVPALLEEGRQVQNPMYRRQSVTSLASQSHGSGMMEPKEVPRLSHVMEDSAASAVMAAEDPDSSRALTPTWPAPEAAPAAVAATPARVPSVAPTVAPLEIAPQEPTPQEPTPTATTSELTEEERAARRAALHAKRMTKRKDEWTLLEESLAIIDSMYKEVFETHV